MYLKYHFVEHGLSCDSEIVEEEEGAKDKRSL